MMDREGGTVIGMETIKRRRLRLPVGCHRGSYVGEYVPFYFCPRSIMLYVIYCANNPDLSYRRGQGPIVHLEADLHETIRWAERSRKRWAFSPSNAGASYAEFFKDLNRLVEINWTAVEATDFRPADTKEGKQAEFLVERSFPWELVERIGVYSRKIGWTAASAMRGALHRPVVEIMPKWYF